MPQALIAAAISIGTSLASAGIGLLFTPSQEIEGQRLDNLNAPKSNYGEPIPKPFGTVRVPGNLFWANKIIERSKKKRRGKGGGGTTTKTYSYFGEFAVLLCEGPIVGIRRIWLNSRVVYDVRDEASAETKANSAAWASKYLSTYLGTNSQGADSLIQSSVGADNCPAYRHRAYLVFRQLPLEEYGNRFPQVSVEVCTSGTVAIPTNPTLASILTYVCQTAGLESSQIDTWDLTDTVRGFLLDRTKTPKEIIEQLQQVYHFHVVESGGRLRFLPYERTQVATITGLAAHEYGQERPQFDYEQERIPDLELPTQISFAYPDPYRDYQTSVVRAKREGNPTGESNPKITLPIVFLSHEAQPKVERMLSLLWLRRRTYKFTLPLRFIFLEAGDVVRLQLNTGYQRVLLSKVMVGANFILECEAIAYEDTIITADPEEATAPDPSPVLGTGEANLKVLDIPLVQDSDTDNGLYLAMDGVKVASVFVSRNAGASWQLAKNLELPSTMGVCNTTLGATGGVSVTITDGELESVLASDLTYGENTALVGNEIIRFETATLTAPNTYNLPESGLIRGVRGTEAYISTHGAGERFVLLSDYLERVEGLTSDLGEELQFKAITGDQSLEDVDPVIVTVVGNSLKPYSPVNLTATKDLTGKITLSWQRRDRKQGEATTYTDLPLSETVESYEIEIFNGASVVRTLTSNSPSVAYSVADQTTDFGGLQTSVTFTVYQISAVFGRGTGKTATLTPTELAATPEITGFTPTGAVVGDTVTVYGTGLTSTTSASIGGTPVTGLTVVDDNSLTFTLPAGAETGKLSLTTPGGTTESATGFFVSDPAGTANLNYEEIRFFL
jgi:hypothetical protein